MATIATKTLKLKSLAFMNNGYIPSKYAYNGANINPDIMIDDLPEGTKSLAIIVEDLYANNSVFCHWVVWNIPPTNSIKENSIPGIQGKNSKNENKYKGPCPRSGVHHYHFRVYALDTLFDSLPTNTGRVGLMNAMEGHVLSSGDIVGLFAKYKPLFLW